MPRSDLVVLHLPLEVVSLAGLDSVVPVQHVGAKIWPAAAHYADDPILAHARAHPSMARVDGLWSAVGCHTHGEPWRSPARRTGPASDSWLHLHPVYRRARHQSVAVEVYLQLDVTRHEPAARRRKFPPKIQLNTLNQDALRSLLVVSGNGPYTLRAVALSAARLDPSYLAATAQCLHTTPVPTIFCFPDWRKGRWPRMNVSASRATSNPARAAGAHSS